MTDTIDKFGSGTVAVQQMANTPKNVFVVADEFIKRGINLREIKLGTGFDNSEK